MKSFKCPKCGGHCFGRDTGKDESGNIVALPNVRCHGDGGIMCDWQGDWPKVGQCPDCGDPVGSDNDFACEACHAKRKAVLAAKEVLPVGGQSLTDEEEAKMKSGQIQVRGNRGRRVIRKADGFS